MGSCDGKVQYHDVKQWQSEAGSRGVRAMCGDVRFYEGKVMSREGVVAFSTVVVRSRGVL